MTDWAIDILASLLRRFLKSFLARMRIFEESSCVVMHACGELRRKLPSSYVESLRLTAEGESVSLVQEISLPRTVDLMRW